MQLNNAAGGRLYFTRPYIPETEIKQLSTMTLIKRRKRQKIRLLYFRMLKFLVIITLCRNMMT